MDARQRGAALRSTATTWQATDQLDAILATIEQRLASAEQAWQATRRINC